MSSTVNAVARPSQNSMLAERQVSKLASSASSAAEPEPRPVRKSSQETAALTAEERQKLIDSQWEDHWSM